jgi:hypothetical protein
MSHEKPVTIYVTDDETEADVIRAALEADGIISATWTNMSHSAFPFTVEAGQMAIQVPPEFAERARQIIEIARQRGEEMEGNGEGGEDGGE